MTANRPTTQAEWLTYLANMAEKYPLATTTATGAEFQRCCIELLENAAAENDSLLDLQADLLTIIPRFLNAITLAQHNGSACPSCASRDAAALYQGIMTDMREQLSRQSMGGTH
ncbi:MAG TPA: hypothetical protein VK181_23210 [Rhizobium sp.]|nr:hypothetical protein [Rhizobium sp.]